VVWELVVVVVRFVVFRGGRMVGGGGCKFNLGVSYIVLAS